jgi:plastocyanin
MNDNVVRNNSFGLDRLDLNGRDLVYTGNGTGNCFQDNTGVETTVPNDPSAFPPCPGPDNQDNQDALLLMIDAGVNKKYRENWIVKPHTAIQGIEPLTDYETGKTYGPTQIAPAPKPRATAAAKRPKRTVKVGDYFFAPQDISVKKGTRVVWRWEEENTDTHDVKLTKGPKGVKRFQSELAATGFSYRKTLRVPGTYTVICTLHPDTMEQKIRVRK